MSQFLSCFYCVFRTSGFPELTSKTVIIFPQMLSKSHFFLLFVIYSFSNFGALAHRGFWRFWQFGIILFLLFYFILFYFVFVCFCLCAACSEAGRFSSFSSDIYYGYLCAIWQGLTRIFITRRPISRKSAEKMIV